MKPLDERDYLVPRLQAYEQRVLAEIAAEQVVKVDLAEYQPGSPRLERLYEQMELAAKYQWPNRGYEVNL